MTKKKTRKNDYKLLITIVLLCLWVAISVIAVQFVLGYLMILVLGLDNFNQPIWTAVYSAVTYVLAMGLIIWVPPRIMAKWKKERRITKKKSLGMMAVSKMSRDELGLSDWPTWTDIGLGPVGFIVSTIFAAGLVGLFSLFPWFDAEQAQNVGFNVYMSGSDRIIAFFTLVVVAPIAEEIIFRGWLYGKIREILHDKIAEKWGILISILVVSVLFGIVHLQWNVGVNVFALSVVLCALREITGTIYAGILTHMIKNGVAFYLLYVIGIA